MTIQEAIEKTIEGGYAGSEKWLLDLPESAKCQIWLDPLFWQYLGKTMGWKNVDYVDYGEGHSLWNEAWLYQWHRFIDCLADGGTPESFFETL